MVGEAEIPIRTLMVRRSGTTKQSTEQLATKRKTDQAANQSSKHQRARHTAANIALAPKAKQTESFKNSASLETVRSGYLFKVDELERALRETSYPEELRNLEGLEHRPVYRTIKRLFDIVFSLVIFAAFWWLYLILAIVVKIDDPKGSPIFVQERIGKNGKPFKMYKFRTMCVDAEERLAEITHLNEKSGPVFKIKNDPRVLRSGRILRKLSLDELPQFWNVLKGDISVVGPRPALPNEVATYNDYQRQRLLIKPGITCYWQTRINRDSISFDDWVDLDLLYIKQCGVWADTKLIVQTVGVVLTAQGN